MKHMTQQPLNPGLFWHLPEGEMRPVLIRVVLAGHDFRTLQNLTVGGVAIPENMARGGGQWLGPLPEVRVSDEGVLIPMPRKAGDS